MEQQQYRFSNLGIGDSCQFSSRAPDVVEACRVSVKIGVQFYKAQ